MIVELIDEVPKQIIVPIAREIRAKLYAQKLRADPEYWDTSLIEDVKTRCGPAYSHIKTDAYKAQLCNLRKNNYLGTVGRHRNHGAMKRPQPPSDYLEYLKSDHWKTFRQTVLEFWGHRCALCYSDDKMDVHHRVYNLYAEKMTDCLALCRRCHVAADRARCRALVAEKAEQGLFE